MEELDARHGPVACHAETGDDAQLRVCQGHGDGAQGSVQLALYQGLSDGRRNGLYDLHVRRAVRDQPPEERPAEQIRHDPDAQRGATHALTASSLTTL